MVVEQGRRAELVAQDGFYARLTKLHGNTIYGSDGSTESPKSDMVRTDAYKSESAKLEAANKRCVELGFLPQTEPFGQCMLRVSK
jgi:hypothetical protein